MGAHCDQIFTELPCQKRLLLHRPPSLQGRVVGEDPGEGFCQVNVLQQQVARDFVQALQQFQLGSQILSQDSLALLQILIATKLESLFPSILPDHLHEGILEVLIVHLISLLSFGTTRRHGSTSKTSKYLRLQNLEPNKQQPGAFQLEP